MVFSNFLRGDRDGGVSVVDRESVGVALSYSYLSSRENLPEKWRLKTPVCLMDERVCYNLSWIENMIVYIKNDHSSDPVDHLFRLLTKNDQSGLLSFFGSDKTIICEVLLKYRDDFLSCHNDMANTKREDLSLCEEYPFVFVQNPHKNNHDKTRSLPENVIKTKNEQYEKFIFPPIYKDLSVYNIKTVYPTELPEYMRQVFGSYECFNKMQSAVFPVAFNTNENMLISSPTGSGKTDIAVISILKVIKDNATIGDQEQPLLLNNVKVDVNAFKVIYIAPMKALATEITKKFEKKLSYMNITIKEYTGDTDLSKKDIDSTQVIVTTPEKWDVFTRKPISSDETFVNLVKLIVIDEIHIINEDRGSVIESIVSRAFTMMEVKQNYCRIIGISATVPNYRDLSEFLKVNPFKGLFVFDDSFRPIPLKQTLIGVKKNISIRGKSQVSYYKNIFNNICYECILPVIKQGNQVMIFVHSRTDTLATAKLIMDRLTKDQLTDTIKPNRQHQKEKYLNNPDIKNLVSNGIGIHNAGLTKTTRNIIEDLFEERFIKILCCTATLAWGINLPAQTVIIKGTDVYDSLQGKFIDLNILDILQIFGRAGRPQYEKFGEGILITSKDSLDKYLTIFNRKSDIVSKLSGNLAEHINAEIVLRNIFNIKEAILWCKFTYMWVRMRREFIRRSWLKRFVSESDHNTENENEILRDLLLRTIDPHLHELSQLKMIKFGDATSQPNNTQNMSNSDNIVENESLELIPLELGRIVSFYYIKCKSLRLVNTFAHINMTEKSLIGLFSRFDEFSNIKLRNLDEKILMHLNEKKCRYKVENNDLTESSKVNILIQAYLNKWNMYVPGTGSSQAGLGSIVSDLYFIESNLGRVFRFLFEVFLHFRYFELSIKVLEISKYFTQLENINNTHKPNDYQRMFLKKHIGNWFGNGDAESLQDICLDVQLIRVIKFCNVRQEVEIEINTTFKNEKEDFYILVGSEEYIIFHEMICIDKNMKSVKRRIRLVRSSGDNTKLVINVTSNTWFMVRSSICVDIGEYNEHSEMIFRKIDSSKLTNISDLERTDNGDRLIHYLTQRHITHLNALQSKVFPFIWNLDEDMFIGSSSASGKTTLSEFALLKHILDIHRNGKKSFLYINSYDIFCKKQLKRFTNLNGIFNINIIDLKNERDVDFNTSNLIICSSSLFLKIYNNREKVVNILEKISVVIIDDIHLIEDPTHKGKALELFLYIMNDIRREIQTRTIFLSIPIFNVKSFCRWARIKEKNTFNFSPSLRLIPVVYSFQKFNLSTIMNKSLFFDISKHSDGKRTIVFVPDHLDVKTTVRSIVSYYSLFNSEVYIREDSHMLPDDLQSSLMYRIAFLHHKMSPKTIDSVMHLFDSNSIVVLVTTPEFSWSLDISSHLVIIKGIDYKYCGVREDYNILDILRMLGCAGEKGDDICKALLYVSDLKNNYIQKATESFQLESGLDPKALLNALTLFYGVPKTQEHLSNLFSTSFTQLRMQEHQEYYGMNMNNIFCELLTEISQ